VIRLNTEFIALYNSKIKTIGNLMIIGLIIYILISFNKAIGQ
jgi:hypothetical protein